MNVRCHAPLNVKEKFTNTKDNAEGEFRFSLQDHYTITKSKLEEKIIETEGATANAFEDAREEDQRGHRDRLETIKRNIEREREKASRKLKPSSKI